MAWREEGRGGRGGRGRGDRGNNFPMPVYGNHELRLPPGWEDCPPFGAPAKLPDGRDFRAIPSKVPLQPAYRRLLRNPGNNYSLVDAVHEVERVHHIQVGMVLDLTNSYRYYDINEELAELYRAEPNRELIYIKVPCKGRGQSPSPAAVNHAVYEMYKFWEYKDAYILVHCTHGFNRTGYVIACAMVRLASLSGMTIDRAVRRFADSRPPGIYKDGYINDLFRYHHEERGRHIITPPVPAWKGVDDDDEGDAVDAEPQPAPMEMRHDVIEHLGEPVPQDEADFIRGMVYDMIIGAPPPPGRNLHFPGSQPVSLARTNLNLLENQRYWVSWKADGTRYLLLLLDRGCYLIDRSYKVVRVQMRFPTPGKGAPPGHQAQYPVGRPHNMTLLDGEMVVDTDPNDGKQYRRYLVYDMAVINGNNVTAEHWLKRFHEMEKHVIVPRHQERAYIKGEIPREKFKAPPINYDYGAEPFSVRKKDFWPLNLSGKVIDNMIPNLCHEADGLILQSCDSQYVANTDNALLKFKFAHLNSVDFKLTVQGPPNNPVYTLSLIDSSRRRVPGQQSPPLRSISTPVDFPPEVDGRSLDNAIIECTWLPDKRCWHYHRTRQDKNTPNAYFVYEKVMVSIEDDIKEHALVEHLERVFWNTPAYEKDRHMVPPDKVPDPLPPPPEYLPLGHPQGLPPPPPLEEDWGEEEPLPEGWAPWSPPYYGPEPTPPHEGPVQPHMWTIHDPSTYPQHLLELPPEQYDQPPEQYNQPPEQYGQDGHHQYDDGHGGGGPQGPGHPYPGHGDGRHYRPEPDINPYYTEPDDLQGPPEHLPPPPPLPDTHGPSGQSFGQAGGQHANGRSAPTARHGGPHIGDAGIHSSGAQAGQQSDAAGVAVGKGAAAARAKRKTEAADGAEKKRAALTYNNDDFDDL